MAGVVKAGAAEAWDDDALDAGDAVVKEDV
jgi:hypothetical protein